MAYKVIYKKRFGNKLIKLLQYFETEWSEQTGYRVFKQNGQENRNAEETTFHWQTVFFKTGCKNYFNFKAKQALL